MSKLYNLKQLEELSGGSNDFIKEIISVFLSEVPVQLEALNLSYGKSDYSKIARLAHKLKPSIDLLGIESIANEIRQIEIMTKKNNPNISIELEKINNVINKVIAELKLLTNP